jgi:transposase
MSHPVYQRPKGTTIHRKKDGRVYLYSTTSYWDKEKKAPRSRQVCLGRFNEETGEVIPSIRRSRTPQRATSVPGITVNAKVYGPYLLLSKIAKDTGLSSALKKVFPDIHKELLSLVFFITQKGLALSRCERWSENHKHPFDKPLSSQRVSKILQLISENDRQRFLSLWLYRLSEKELLCYDITSISSYATANEYLSRGYSRSKEKKLPQVNLATLFGQESGLPAYYRRMPGNINDVSTLKTTIDSLDFLGKGKLRFVLDRGFYSEGNIKALLDKRYRFILTVPTGRVWVRNIIDLYYDKTHLPHHYHITGKDEGYFMVSHRLQWGNRRCYAHLYFNATKTAEEFDKFLRKLAECKKELETDNRMDSNQEFYERFFITKKTPKRGLSIKFNEAEIEKQKNRYSGFFCILTNMTISSVELLETYRRKDIIEKGFDDLKNELDMKRLRVHSSETMETRLFIQFLALVLMSAIRKEVKKNKKLQYMSVRDIMETLESVTLITYSGRYGSVISETGPLQRTVSQAFGITLEA